ncbi:MAG: hypothetical protein IPO21_01870 [Bacteroidales bacterium]|nr:hypothetical protein [Bacteroidales bacterium]
MFENINFDTYDGNILAAIVFDIVHNIRFFFITNQNQNAKIQNLKFISVNMDI